MLKITKNRTILRLFCDILHQKQKKSPNSSSQKDNVSKVPNLSSMRENESIKKYLEKRNIKPTGN